MKSSAISPISIQSVHEFVESVVGDDLHAMRVLSLANATLGVIHAAALGVAAIGRGMAQARNVDSKHAIKQVDRLLSNSAVNVWRLFAAWVPYLVGERREIVVALDWTDFDADDQTTLALHLLTNHGRATPLMWKTVVKSRLRGHRNRIEDELLARLKEVVPTGTKVTVVADRGFGDTLLYDYLKNELGFDYVIRFRGNIKVTSSNGETRDASAWLSPSGRAVVLRDARVTNENNVVPSVIAVKKAKMKEGWFLASSLPGPANPVITLYGKRFTIEENFRDTKDIRFGMGLSSSRISDPTRRDRVLLISAMAVVLLTLLGAAGEAIGLDRKLKANTSKKRTHSLIFQGTYYYGALPNMREEQFRPLIEKFGAMLSELVFVRQAFGLV
jgi:hypothetical protein